MCNKNVKRDGKFLEEVGYGVIWVHNKQVGTYNPIPLDDGIKLDRIKYWLSVGAQPSETVAMLLGRVALVVSIET